MSDGHDIQHKKTFTSENGFTFKKGECQPWTWPESSLESTPRERFEEQLLNLGVPVSVAFAAGCVFDAELESRTTAIAADKMRKLLTLMASTKLVKSIEYLAILKLFSPDRSLAEICSGTGHSKQRLHFQVRKMQRFFDETTIGE